MKHVVFLVFLACWIGAHAQPLRLHPANPHYFEYRGKPTVLITSAMHYSAVLNLDIDYDQYLAVLHEHGFNQHREFLEASYPDTDPTDWTKSQGPLGPRPGRLILPWARSSVPGYVDGDNRFDLDRWDENYFRRLKDFVRKAQDHGIVIEIVLSNVLYSENNWRRSPLNANNNINGIGYGRYNDYNFGREPALFEKQKQLVRKVVSELNEFDNVYYELCNEPYWAKGIPENNPEIKQQHVFEPDVVAWQRALAQVAVEAEQNLPKKHLLAENIANTYFKVETPSHPAVSILNFHYAVPPAAVPVNWALNKPVAFDETFDGTNAPDRRTEAWAFLLAGGAVYSNLDWSFAIDDITGTGRNPSGRRRSGVEVRSQLAMLKRFMESLDFVNMTPVDSASVTGVPSKVEVYGLAREGADYALYFLKRAEVEVPSLHLQCPAGTYQVRWLDPRDGSSRGETTVRHSGGELALTPPAFSDDLVLRVTRP